MSQKTDTGVNHPPMLLFLGDSLIDYGNWPQRLPNYQVISSGMPGERTEELLWRLPRSLPEQPPDMIIVMSGTNNILFGDRSFTASLKNIVDFLSNTLPTSQRLITSLLPYDIPGSQKSIYAANNTLREIAEQSNSHYFDLYTPFTEARGKMFEYDGVHLSEAGYSVWASQLERYLSSWLVK